MGMQHKLDGIKTARSKRIKASKVFNTNFEGIYKHLIWTANVIVTCK